MSLTSYRKLTNILLSKRFKHAADALCRQIGIGKKESCIAAFPLYLSLGIAS